MEPKLIMMIGIPGSGKSSWLAKQRLDPLFFSIFSPDATRKQLFGDISDQSHNIVVWNSLKYKVGIDLSRGKSVIIDATNVNTAHRRNFIQNLPPCKLQAKLFPADPAQCYARILEDLERKKDRSNVPEETVFRMYGEYLYSEKIIQSEGFEIIENITALKSEKTIIL
jgi:predicted kinase